MSPTATKPRTAASLAVAVSNGRWEHAAHLDLLDEALYWLNRREAPAGFLRRLISQRPIDPDIPDDEMLPYLRLVVQLPPRHGKSELISKYFCAHYLGTNPTHHIILTSYEANYARSWGRKARDVLEQTGLEAYGVTVSRTTSAANDWELVGTGGGMITAGIGGAITGRGANALVIDDPVKNSEQAASEAIQTRNYDWYVSTAYTRLETDENGLEGIVLLVQTRWNQKDLAGQILADEEALDDGEVWYTLDMPALALEGDVLGRPYGAPLWPERYPLKRLERIRRRLKSYWWSALYQQRPTPEQGNLFMRGWWQRYDSMPTGNHPGYNVIDTAGWDDKDGGDYAVIAPIVRVQRDLYWLRDFRRGHYTFTELLQECIDLHALNGLPFLIEDVPWAKPLIQSLREQLRDEGVPIIPFKIEGVNKTARAAAATPYVEEGRCWLPRNAPWLSDFIEEHAEFPKGAHDDQVDTTSMAVLRMLIKHMGGTRSAVGRSTSVRMRRGSGPAMQQYGGRA